MASTPSSTTSNDLLPAYEDVVGTIPGQEEGTRSSISGVNEEDDPKTPTPTSRRSPLEKPIAIPQTRYGIGKPYVRAYSDELVRFDISKQQFMEFVDELNVSATFTSLIRRGLADTTRKDRYIWLASLRLY